MSGAEPLTPPTADVAQAYLDEAERVRSRRDEYVDRRGAAWLALTEAVVLPVYVTIAGLAIGFTSANSAFLIWLALFFVWIQLSTERREGLGGLKRSASKAWLAAIWSGLLVCGLLGVVVAALLGNRPPMVLFFVPGVAAFLILGIPAIRDIRSSAPADSPRERRPLAAAERWATFVIALVLAVSTCALAYADDLVLPLVAMVLMGGYLAWWTVGRISESLPVPGAVWAWPQWLAFAIGAAGATSALIVRLLESTPTTGPLPMIGSVLIIALIVTSAFMDGRDG